MQNMTPSDEQISPGEIAKINELLAAALRKSGLRSEPTQEVIEKQGKRLATDLLGVVRKYVEMVSSFIIRLVTGVDRTLSPAQVIDATGRRQYVDKKVLESMPRGEGKDIELIFFPISKRASDADVEKTYEEYGLKPADPYSLARANQDDPAFADEKPNATVWKDADGKWCYVAFSQWVGGERSVNVDRFDNDWRGDWWFAGVRK